MLLSKDDEDALGKTLWERLCRGASAQLRERKFAGKAYVGPQTFQDLQHELVYLRDPTLRADWDGDRCCLVVSVCGHKLVVRTQWDIAERDILLEERAR
jgi:hypothetical protein